ncbi:hypothetical protein [Umezawaea sp. Da 62-37]|uniref:hypothetical protein n=1 Tax=Umezawaea sp. Da 62-37 TaxID=3075927 RepID=UPI0028F6D218|nr:hypothetical protein [Umezawaea sp. Da 62-37]WNV88617.1 hypothetical protein RM788_10060 [Umezawaea sp. Da 62-37]
MAHGIRYIAAWLASTAVAVALSWLGVRSVLDAGVQQRPQVVTGRTLETSSATTTATTTRPSSPPPPSSATSTPSAGSNSSAASTTSSSSTTPSTPARLASTEGSWSEENGKQVYIRSFQLDGGEVAVRFAADSVQTISATPRQGFAVSVQQPAGTSLVVEFQNPTEKSKLEANWQDGPRWKITEAG